MSYILEALKKSQQERELGKVPTLDASGMFEEDTAGPPRSPWPLVAMGLAGAAVLIALYAALRAPLPVAVTGSPSVEKGAESAMEAEKTLSLSPAPPPLLAQRMDNLSASRLPMVPAPNSTTLDAPLDAFEGPEAEPLVEPPPPHRPTRPKPAESVQGVGVRGDRKLVHPDLSEESGLAAELELQRQLEAELGMTSYEEDITSDPPTPVPRDLIADIEAFKHEVLSDGGGAAAKKASAPSHIDEDPTKLRLTREQQKDLPAFLMTVHVYDAEKSRRFVLISGRKYGEGDQTRQGMKVERILADGAVLSYRGNPFFVHR